MIDTSKDSGKVSKKTSKKQHTTFNVNAAEFSPQRKAKAQSSGQQSKDKSKNDARNQAYVPPTRGRRLQKEVRAKPVPIEQLPALEEIVLMNMNIRGINGEVK